jgi:predicted HD phosphohydrolase
MRDSVETVGDGYCPLAHDGWERVHSTALDRMSAEEWAAVDRQLPAYRAERQAERALELLAREGREPSYGYPVNNYRHCLESATRVWQAGFDEARIVTALFHDIGFTMAGPNHGLFAAALIGPHVGADNEWLMANHQAFQAWHFVNHPTADRYQREVLRGHPMFAETADFVARFDQNAVDPNFAPHPLDAFRPMVHRVFGRQQQVR